MNFLAISFKEDKTEFANFVFKKNLFLVKEAGFFESCFLEISDGKEESLAKKLTSFIKNFSLVDQIYISLPTGIFSIDFFQENEIKLIDVKAAVKKNFLIDEFFEMYIDQSCTFLYQKNAEDSFKITGAAVEKKYINVFERLIENYGFNICSLEPENVSLSRIAFQNSNNFILVERFSNNIVASVFSDKYGLFSVPFSDDDTLTFDDIILLLEQIIDETFDEQFCQNKIPIFLNGLSKTDFVHIGKSKYSNQVKQLKIPEYFKLDKKVKINLNAMSNLCGLVTKVLLVNNDFDTKIQLGGNVIEQRQINTGRNKNEFSIFKIISEKLLSLKKKKNNKNF